MKFSEIKAELEPFEALIETIPKAQIQGRKIATYLLSSLEASFHKIAEMAERIDYLESELFGKKKNNEDPDSQELEGNEESAADDETSAEDEKEAKKKIEKARPQEKKEPKGEPKSQTIRIEVPDGMRCKCCHGRIYDEGLGHKAGELHLKLMEMVDRIYLLHRGACKCGEVSFEMPRPTRALEQRAYSPELISHLIVQKFKFHLPIYRQQKQFLDLGVYVNRNVLNELIGKAWEQVEPVVKRLHQIAREEEYRRCDETPICRIKNGKSRRNYLWCLHTRRAIVFMLTEKRNQKLAKEFIGSGGNIMTDGLGIYSEKSIDGIHGNCLSHVLQRYFRSFSSFPEESDKVIDYIAKVYEVEREADSKGLDAFGRLELRKKESADLMGELKQYLEGLNPPPRSSLGKAINYTLERWGRVTAFLKDGDMPVDNNKVESIFRDVKLGLKNFLFVGSDLGGQALAGFYSLIMTCELHGVNPMHYIADVLIRIANGHPASKLDELLPWNWELGGADRLEIDDSSDYLKASYPREYLLKRLGLEDKVYFEENLESSSDLENPDILAS